MAADSERPRNEPHAVVIGSGFGGLAAAVRMGARGYRVTVLERLAGPGGRARVFEQDGFTFDAGPTIITAPHLLGELWTLCGRRMEEDVQLKDMDPFYRIRFDDGTTFVYNRDLDHMRREVARFEPADVESYDRFLAESERIYKVAFEQLVDQPFHRMSTVLKAMPDLIRLGGYRTVYDKVKKHFRNDKLRQVFSYHPLLIGGNPFSATSYYCLISHLEREYGVHYAMGGTHALVRGLVGLIEGQGNRVRCNADVTRIEVDERGRACGVQLSSGERLEADVVVSNVDPAFTYSKLLRHHPRRRWTDRRIHGARYSMGLFVWYFGTSRRFEDVYHHTLILGPRYRELLDDIFTRKVLAEDFSMYLHRPSASDPSVAPDGCDAFYVLAPVPHLGSGTNWAAKSEEFRMALQRRLEETIMPGLSECIATSRVMHPQHFQDELNSVNGAGFSLEPHLLQSSWFRPHNLSEEVEGLYLVGAGTHPGAGIPGVVASARVLDKVVPAADSLRSASLTPPSPVTGGAG